MANLLANMNATRVFILVSLLVAGVLGWMVLRMKGDLSDLDRQRNTLAPNIVTQIQQKAHQYEALDKLLNTDKFARQDTPATYIRTIAGEPKVSIGQVDVAPSSQPIGQGVVDRNYKIDPSDRNREYTRLHIANFLYRLEEDSQKVKVTHLKITPNASGGRPDSERPIEDAWTFSATITSRESQGS